MIWAKGRCLTYLATKVPQKGTCYDEHWVLYVSDEPLNSTSETVIAMYVNYQNLNENLKEKSLKNNVIYNVFKNKDKISYESLKICRETYAKSHKMLIQKKLSVICLN